MSNDPERTKTDELVASVSTTDEFKPEIRQPLGRTKPLQHLPASISVPFRRKPPAPAPLPVSPRIKAALKPRKKR